MIRKYGRYSNKPRGMRAKIEKPVGSDKNREKIALEDRYGIKEGHSMTKYTKNEYSRFYLKTYLSQKGGDQILRGPKHDLTGELNHVTVKNL
ncbi:hypothetical protein KJ966_00455 [bacterium]|nr:hypothetical protein [bacterium]